MSILLADKWKQLDSEEKQHFFDEAEKLKNLHQLQHPNYKFNPKAKRIGMKKSIARLEPLTRVPGGQPQEEFTVNLPELSEENNQVSIHNLGQEQNIIIQPVDSVPMPIPPEQTTTTQIIPLPEADQTITTSVVELE